VKAPCCDLLPLPEEQGYEAGGPNQQLARSWRLVALPATSNLSNGNGTGMLHDKKPTYKYKASVSHLSTCLAAIYRYINGPTKNQKKIKEEPVGPAARGAKNQKNPQKTKKPNAHVHVQKKIPSKRHPPTSVNLFLTYFF
jgi:hypothetical protein